MAENRKLWVTIALITTISIVIVMTIGGLFLWDISKVDKETAKIEKAAAKTNPESKEEKKEAEVKAPDGSYDGWLIYENAMLGYTLKYPADWTYKMETSTAAGAAAEYVTFNNDDNDYAFSFGLRKVGSTTLVTRGTPVGTGAPETGGTVKILGQDVDKTYYVDNGRVSIIFYGKGLGVNITIGDNEIAAELRVPGYDDKSLKGSPQEAIADMIISSLTFK